MAITVEWHNVEYTVLRLKFLGSWNWDELDRAIDIAASLAADRPFPVGAIIDLTNADTLPAGSWLDSGFRARALDLAQRANGRQGRIVVVGASAWITSLYGLFQGLLGPRAGTIAFRDSLPQAYDLLSGSPGPAPFGPSPAEAA